jgi:hypothetical protein
MASTRTQKSKPLWDGIATFLAADASDNDGSEWVQLKCVLIDASTLTEQLKKDVSALPHLNTHDHISAELEERYANKEKLEKELGVTAERLRSMLPDLARRVDRCCQILQRIRVDSGKLNLPEPRKGYGEAEDAARKEYLKVLHYRDWTAVTVTKAQAVLELARKKPVPRSTPRQKIPTVPDGSGPYGNSVKNSKIEQNRQSETDGLISLGPLENSKDKVH